MSTLAFRFATIDVQTTRYSEILLSDLRAGGRGGASRAAKAWSPARRAACAGGAGRAGDRNGAAGPGRALVAICASSTVAKADCALAIVKANSDTSDGAIVKPGVSVGRWCLEGTQA
jgi:hypothetical protein